MGTIALNRFIRETFGRSNRIGKVLPNNPSIIAFLWTLRIYEKGSGSLVCLCARLLAKGWFELLVFWTWMKQGQLCSQISRVPGLKSFYWLRNMSMVHAVATNWNPGVGLNSWVRSSRALCSFWGCAILSFTLPWLRRMLRLDMFNVSFMNFGQAEFGWHCCREHLVLHFVVLTLRNRYHSFTNRYWQHVGPLGGYSSLSKVLG